MTREHFSSAVHAVTDGIKAVSRTVEVLKSNMREGFVSLTGHVEANRRVTEEVAEVVDELQRDIKDVHEVVKGCEQFLLESSRKQDVTMRACSCSAESWPSPCRAAPPPRSASSSSCAAPRTSCRPPASRRSTILAAAGSSAASHHRRHRTITSGASRVTPASPSTSSSSFCSSRHQRLRKSASRDRHHQEAAVDEEEEDGEDGAGSLSSLTDHHNGTPPRRSSSNKQQQQQQQQQQAGGRQHQEQRQPEEGAFGERGERGGHRGARGRQRGVELGSGAVAAEGEEGKGGGEKQQFQVLEIVVVVVVEAPPPVRASGGEHSVGALGTILQRRRQALLFVGGDLSSLGDDDGVGVSGGGIILGACGAGQRPRAAHRRRLRAGERPRGAQENYDEAEEGSCTSSSMSEVAPPPRHGNHVAAAY